MPMVTTAADGAGVLTDTIHAGQATEETDQNGFCHTEFGTSEITLRSRA